MKIDKRKTTCDAHTKGAQQNSGTLDTKLAAAGKTSAFGTVLNIKACALSSLGAGMR